MNFGEALALLRVGTAVTRHGWNGLGMYVVYQKGYPDGIPINENTAAALKQPVGTIGYFRPYLMMRTATLEYVPWVASQSDLLAEDWDLAELPN